MIDESIKPIQTRYNGRFYRSRLEARWATFFDSIGIKFEYELEGYELSNGQRYLPDFYLPTFDGGLWCEVKPLGGDFFKAKKFCDDYEENMWFCEGMPDKAIYRIYQGKEHHFACGIPNWDEAYGEDRMFWMPCQNPCGELCRGEHPIPVGDEVWFRSDANRFIAEAIEMALSARF